MTVNCVNIYTIFKQTVYDTDLKLLTCVHLFSILSHPAVSQFHHTLFDNVRLVWVNIYRKAVDNGLDMQVALQLVH